MSDKKSFHEAEEYARQDAAADKRAETAQAGDEGESGKDTEPSAGDVIEKLNAENAELKNRLMLLAADMENLRKRTARDIADAKTYAVSAFARDMLSVADNLERALAALPAEAVKEDARLKSLAEGVEMTGRSMMTALQNHGVRKIEALGRKFDPNLHQAIFESEDKSVPHNTVQQELQPGYSIGGRVLRAAQVGIAKGGEKPAAEPQKPQEH